MKAAEFQEILDEEIKRVTDMLGVKADEYASDKDRLHNFKQAAHLEHVTMEQALGGMMSKHTVSVYDMIASGEMYPMAQWAEKITDHINYLILLKAIVTDRFRLWEQMAAENTFYQPKYGDPPLGLDQFDREDRPRTTT